MSHEQLTPLNAILNISELVKDEPLVADEPDLKRNLDIIWQSGKILEYNIRSQLTQLQIMNSQDFLPHLECKNSNHSDLKGLVYDVIAPF